MKKMILIALLTITIVMAESYIMTEGSPLRKESATVTSPQDNTTNPLPTQPFNVLDYGLKGDGITDDSAALNTLAKNTGVTNWYFPAGKTFRLVAIDVPPHVEAVYGGAEIRSIAEDTMHPRGPFFQNTLHPDGLLFDGINFTYDSTVSHSINHDYGAITLNNVNNVEVRNCTFTGNDVSPLNAFTVFGEIENGGSNNIYIHHNNFNYIPACSIELVNNSESDRDNENILNNIVIEHNTFDLQGRTEEWRCAISFSGVRGTSNASNNTFKGGHVWDVELNKCDKVTISYNHSTGNISQFIASEGTESNPNGYTLGTNYIHHNHFESEGSSVKFVHGSDTKVYENFIKGQFWQYGGTGGEVYNNTIVKDRDGATYGVWSPLPVFVGSSNGSAVNFHHNDVYYIGEQYEVISIDEASTETAIVDSNNLYRTATTGNMVQTMGSPATVTNNTETYNYPVGSVPTSRDGAGLSNPDTIGSQ